jgi:stage V sporulation protein D (sporulation-specific penicillin-binding protein)
VALPGISNKKRLNVVLVLVAIIFLFLIGKIGYIIFFQGPELQEKAKGQWTRDLPVSPKRGSILDRNGNILAQSASADTVVLRPAEIKDPASLAAKLAPVLKMEEKDIVDKAADKKKSEVWLIRQISREQKAQVEAMNLEGVHFTIDTKRYYPNKDLLTQVLGFTSIDGNGLEGLEAKYDKYLKGQPGRIVNEADRKGQEIPLSDEVYIPPKDGYNAVLTIDLVIQSFLEKNLKEAYTAKKAKGVQGIVVDPKTGEILAMGCYPNYDLNTPPRNEPDTLKEQSRNKVVVDVFEPGSTFKIITTASAIDSGKASLDSHYNCPGFRMVDGQKIKCWRFGHPHGQQDLRKAVQNSCNPAFMDMALAMGKETFYQYIYNFGFGTATNIDYSADQQGLVTHQKYIKNTDLARIGFGQSIAVTTLQLAMGASAVVNGGTLYKPYLVKRLTDTDGNTVKEFSPTAVRKVISDQTSATMRDILESVVAEGTGRNAYIPGYRVGGKTGTAQKYADGKIVQGKHIGSFIGFAPANDPKLLVFIVVDEPDVPVDFGSVVAAPYVKAVLNDSLKYLNVAPQYSDKDKETKQVEVPDVRNLSLESAKNALKDVGLGFMEDGDGKVVDQMPAPKTKADPNTMVLLYMQYENKDEPEEEMVEVPDLKKKSIQDAAKLLKDMGLTLEPAGSGLADYQKPAAGEKVQKGTAVRVEFKNP